MPFRRRFRRRSTSSPNTKGYMPALDIIGGRNDVAAAEIAETKPPKASTGWNYLPVEIQLMILNFVALHKGVGRCAAVSKSWQAALEKKNFHRLKLNVALSGGLDDDLKQLKRFVGPRKRGLVKHIWVNMQLRPYSCRRCRSETEDEQQFERNRDGYHLKLAISELFLILSTWEPANDGSGLTLELSAQSSGNQKHCFKNLFFGAPGEDEGDCGLETKNQLHHDPTHGWVDGRQVRPPSREEIYEIFDRPLPLLYRASCPRVNAVTKLVLRRQNRQYMLADNSGYFFQVLPRLQTLLYEPWQAYGNVDQGTSDKLHCCFLRLLPKTLKRISLFENVNEDYTAVYQQQAHLPVQGRPRVPTPALSAAFAQKSLALEQVSVAFMADARHFFEACQPSWSWEHLQSLALTSPLLTQTSAHVSRLLANGAACALRMPKLHTMAVWNGKRGEACSFTYRREGGCASVTWRGTWALELDDGLVRAWEEVAAKHGETDFRVRTEPLISDVIDSHGDAIHYLRLPDGVIDPVSLWQIRRETATGWRHDVSTDVSTEEV